MTPRHAHRSLPRRPRAFTLIELIAAVAIAVLLMLGVQQVFSITSQGIAGGQALSTVQRDNRTAHSVIYADLKNAVTTDAPFFLIRSERVSAFRNAADAAGDRDYDPADPLDDIDRQVRTTDVDGNNSEADPIDLQSTTALTARNHRVDTVRFFARDFYRRKTGNDGTFVSQVASLEAYIVYGHLRQPEDAAGTAPPNAREPGIRHAGAKQSVTENPNNFYAQQWLLGRNVFVLREPVVDAVGNRFIMDGGIAQWYIGRATTAPPDSLAPFSQNSRATNNGTISPTATPVQYSRYDLMGIGIERARQVFAAGILDPIRAAADDWNDLIDFRFVGWQYPTRPHTSFGLARTSPVFIAGCSQFVVEYAGDFVGQNPTTGAAESVGPDGTIDFVPIFNGATNPVKRRVRWYGFPRNVDTSDDTAPGVPNGTMVRGVTVLGGAVDLLDVVPLRDVLLSIPGAVEAAPFERWFNPAGPNGVSLPQMPNYAAPGAVAPTASYNCAWGPPGTFTNWAGAPVPDPPMPRMLRFVIGIDDPGNRLNEAQLYEYVVELP